MEPTLEDVREYIYLHLLPKTYGVAAGVTMAPGTGPQPNADLVDHLVKLVGMVDELIAAEGD